MAMVVRLKKCVFTVVQSHNRMIILQPQTSRMACVASGSGFLEH